MEFSRARLMSMRSMASHQPILLLIKCHGTDKATPEVSATIDSIRDHHQLLAHLPYYRKLPPHDIWQVLATQLFRKEHDTMQHSASKPKESITING